MNQDKTRRLCSNHSICDPGRTGVDQATSRLQTSPTSRTQLHRPNGLAAIRRVTTVAVRPVVAPGPMIAAGARPS
jgi:hypothetical protein